MSEPTGDSPDDMAARLAAALEQVDHLETALVSARVIGIAIGILMVRRLLTREAAFDVLLVESKHRNRKVRDLADEIVHTGTLGPPPAAGRNRRD